VRRPRPDLTPFLALWVALAFLALSCTPVPTPLSPDARAAFHATRVVQVLDVVRDAAIAANEVVPPVLSTNATRQVVLWHKTAVQTIQAVPNGWQATVKAGIYTLTCDPYAIANPPPISPPPCQSPLAPAEVARLTPYVRLALVVIGEVQ
jgi:hypothetical protein